MKIYTSEEIESLIRASGAEAENTQMAIACALLAIAKLLYNQHYGKGLMLLKAHKDRRD